MDNKSKIINFLEFILNIVIGQSSDYKRDKYLLKYGYPEKTKIFIDRRQNITALIGKEALLSVMENPLFRKIEAGIKKNGYYKLP